MSECECEKRVEGRKEYTAALKICDCDCDCDCRCCIDLFYSTIEDDPDRLQKMDKIQFVHTPLHDAAAAGNTTLAVEIMNLRPSLAKKLNPRGLSPLHLAVESRNTATALALVKLDKQLVQIKGKGGLTPLHYAAARKPVNVGEMELLAGMLAECPEAMGVLNNRLQSAVHVALENENAVAARLLVNWVVIMAKESDLSIKDAHGYTALHVAARYCRSRELLKLLTKLVKLNKANKYGETALDIAIHHNNGDAVEVLKNAGAMKQTSRGEQPLPRKPSTTVRYLCGNHADKCAETLTRAYYFITKELTMDMRNTILVVAALIATTTYQGVLQPPGGVYSAEGSSIVTDRLGRQLGELNQTTHPPGRMVMGTTKYSYFLPTNTLAFISATLIIIYALPDRAFVVILQACLIFMCIGYLLALNFISYYNNFSRILDIVCCCTLGIAFSLKLGYYCVKAYYNDEDWLLRRRLGIMIINHMARFRENVVPKNIDGDSEISVWRRMRKQYKLIYRRVG